MSHNNPDEKELPTLNTNDPLEVVAELLHVTWREYMAKVGFVWGPRRSRDEEKPQTHPHMIAWSQKESYERNQDRFQAAIILHAWANGEIESEDRLARAIHQTWGAWMYIRGNPDESHPQLKDCEDAHVKGGRARPDHKDQAKVIYAYLQMVSKYARADQWAISGKNTVFSETE